jgi:hypothetical protein
MGGSLWSGWAAFESFFRCQCALELPDDLTTRAVAYETTVRSAGYWWPNQDFIMASDRAESISRDARGRLHGQSSMAIRYRDGWGIYCWHGVRLKPWIIERPQEISTQKIESEQNAEVRRILIERFGFDRYLREGGLKLVQQDDFGRLFRREYSDGEPAIAMVEVVNSTAEPDGTHRKYVLPVRSTVRTAHEAVASSFGLTVKEYAPTKET